MTTLIPGHAVTARRATVHAPEAQTRLVETALDLIRRLPFDQVTARRVTSEAQLSLPTILRNFGSMEVLFTRVAQELLELAMARRSHLQDSSIFFDPDFVLRSRLVAWLIGEGADPAGFRSAAMGDLLGQMREEAGGLSERTAFTWLQVLSFIVEGHAIFADVHALSDQEFADGYTLVATLRDLLPYVERQLGWAD